MNLLYKGAYDERFRRVVPLIEGKSVLELCFGDTQIAVFCTQNGIRWTGIDNSLVFVKNACSEKRDAQQADIKELDKFPEADCCIICGSLCYFHADLENMFRKMLAASPKIILSEPVKNLSAQKGWLGTWVRKMPFLEGTGKYFRFNESSLKETLEHFSKKLDFKYRIVEQFNKDLIVVITRN